MATVLSSQAQEKSTNPISTDHTSQSSSKHIAKCYQADRQVNTSIGYGSETEPSLSVKFLHLQAEIDMLLQELQVLKQQKEIIAKQSPSAK